MNTNANDSRRSKRPRPEGGDGNSSGETDPSVMLRLYLTGVAEQGSAPKYGYKKKGSQFACMLSLLLRGQLTELRGVGLSKVEAKQAVCANALRMVYPDCDTLSEVHAQLWRDIKSRQAAGLPAQAGPGTDDCTPSSASESSHPSSDTPAESDVSVDPIVAAMQQVTTMPRFSNIRKQSGGSTPSHISIRRAQAADASEMMRLIVELAVYEKEPDAVKITEETLRNDGWGCKGTRYTSPRFYCFLAVEHLPGGAESVVGMAMFFPNYSTWQGMCCYLEDLVVSEQYRGRGIGDALVHAVGNVCLITGMSRLNWQCLKWNEKALSFYSSLGAVTMPEWEDLRMTKDAMQRTFGGDAEEGSVPSAAPHQTSSKPQEAPVVSSWSSAFSQANQVGSALDDDISNFLSKKQKVHVVSLGTNGDTENTEEVGGFNQPRLLSDFVRNTSSRK